MKNGEKRNRRVRRCPWDELLWRLAQGMTLKTALCFQGAPTQREVFDRRRDDTKFNKDFLTAQRAGADVIFDDMVDAIHEAQESVDIQKAKVLFNIYKFRVQVLNPKKYAAREIAEAEAMKPTRILLVAGGQKSHEEK